MTVTLHLRLRAPVLYSTCWWSSTLRRVEEVPTGCHQWAGCPKKPRPGVMLWICWRRAGVLRGKAVSQRLRAKTQGPSLMVAWQDIPWKKIQRHVFRLQKRIYRATQHGPPV